MNKYIISTIICLFLSACTATNPPEAPKAKGKWEQLNATVSQIMKGYE